MTTGVQRKRRVNNGAKYNALPPASSIDSLIPQVKMLESTAEYASSRIQSYGLRPKTCPNTFTKTPRTPITTPRTIHPTTPQTCPAAFTKTPRTPITTPRTIHPTTPRTSRTLPRTPLSNTFDPISKEVKYGDPNHRQCAPMYRPASAYLQRDNYSKYNDKTHTSATTIRNTSGMIWAIPHPLMPTGYKLPRAYLKFDDLTSKNYFEKKVRKVGEEADSLKKKLCPYSPIANRNLKNEVTRTPVGIHSRDCRNASYLNLVSGKHGYFKTPMTTNQSFLRRLKNPTGFNNSVIFAAKSKLYHKLQRRFD